MIYCNWLQSVRECEDVWDWFKLSRLFIRYWQLDENWVYYKASIEWLQDLVRDGSKLWNTCQRYHDKYVDWFYVFQVVKAFVMLTESYQSADKEKLVIELQEHAKNVTAPYKYPRKVSIHMFRCAINVSVHKLMFSYELGTYYCSFNLKEDDRRLWV